MTDQPRRSDVPSDTSAKKPYTTPEVVVHGSLEEITKIQDKKVGPTDGFSFMGISITNAS
jgi:hypothetical protein